MNLEYMATIKPRISDINYGGHLGHTELINLLHEIRVRFLDQHSMHEANICGHGLVIHNINVKYHQEAYWGNELEVKMETKVDGAKIIFDYTVFNSTLKNKTATAEAVMVLVDKVTKRPVKPDIFIRKLTNGNDKGKCEQDYHQ